MILRDIGYAKINLALHVRERMRDGYHRIETLFAFCEDGDALSVAPADTLRLDIVGPFADGLNAGEDNLVMRAARALSSDARQTRGAALRLDKRLPIASGIGGGSADAAAALRLLARFWALDTSEARLLAIAGALGADVPACLASRTARGDGRGDELVADDTLALSGTPVLLVNPGVSLPTGAVFAAWDGIDRGPLGRDWRGARNDLASAARALRPEINEVLARLEPSPGVTLSRMSGSGATCFALFADKQARDAADAAIARAHPDWWRLSSRLR